MGPETPPGTRYAISALAQRPGTQMSAVLLAKALISCLPEDTVVIACARDDRLLMNYVRAGFAEGQDRRIYKVLEG